MGDAPQDRDLWVQRNSSELLDELRKCIPRFVYRRLQNGKSRRPRQNLSNAAVKHVSRLLEMFQEWPQLLDPSLDTIINPLSSAFLESLHSSSGKYEDLHLRIKGNVCFPQAVCIMLYAICNTRGSKVVVRFLSNEAKHLEPMLTAYESWDHTTRSQQSDYQALAWEERYVLLLWLSHLLLTPFDLSTVGSDAESKIIVSQHSEELVLPADLPSISRRILFVAIDSLSAASKEREASVLVLVRLAMRSDMRRLGMHEILIRWAISQLKSLQKSKKEAGYLFIGLLSFLASIIKSSDAIDIASLLLFIFDSIEALAISQSGSSSALTRKAAIKIFSACAVAALSLEEQPNSKFHFSSHILESVIQELLSALGDNDTPVRQAASKALSIIAAKLDPAMAADISEAVIAMLEENVLWESITVSLFGSKYMVQKQTIKQRNLTFVSAPKWQGLVLTLSQLLFRRCPSVTQLPAILNVLVLALSFEQRSSSGVSIGANVRDAACFGIWALARRYSTEELLAIKTGAMPVAEERSLTTSVIQLLAIELLVAASIDTAGNIRRGASAALQELVGRHPDTVISGIPLVQIVDYSAVALHSRAVKQVAMDAARLDDLYWEAITHGLTTWRGIRATDIETRRLTADTLGLLSVLQSLNRIKLVSVSIKRISDSTTDSVQKKQGFLLAVAALIRNAAYVLPEKESEMKETLNEYWSILSGSYLSDDELIAHTVHPELIAEAVSRLIFELTSAVRSTSIILPPSVDTIKNCFRYLDFALRRNEQAVLLHAIPAIRALVDLADHNESETWLEQTMGKTRISQISSAGISTGYILGLSSVYSSSTLNDHNRESILQHILDAASTTAHVDTRVMALQGLIAIISSNAPDVALLSAMVGVVQAALKDYTTDQRGDVGSLLRLKGIEAVSAAFEKGSLQKSSEGIVLLKLVCTLAAEKLDRVRQSAWHCLVLCWNLDDLEQPATYLDEYPPYATTKETGNDDRSTSITSSYFDTLLKLQKYHGLQESLLRGLIVSAGGGSESVLLAARTALSDWLHDRSHSSELENFANCFCGLLKTSLETDRLITPALDTLSFILDTNIFTAENSKLLPWRKILILTQKAHFKSTNMARLLSAIEVYGGLGLVEVNRQDVIKKLAALLIHPFPIVRGAAAGTLFSLTGEGSLKPIDWSDNPKHNKQGLAIVKESLEIS